MIIDLTFVNSAPTSFQDAVQEAASMLDAAVTDNITVNIEVGYGIFPSDGSSVPPQDAEGDPNFNTASSFAYSAVVSALRASAAPDDSNFQALPNGATIVGFNDGFGSPSTKNYPQVLVWSAEEKALGFIPADQPGADGFIGLGTDIAANDLVGVALHELTHAMGRAPFGLPDDGTDAPDIFDLFRFDTANGERLVIDNGGSAPPAYFSVNGGATNLADYGKTSDPSDFLNTSTPNDAFDEFLRQQYQTISHAA